MTTDDLDIVLLKDSNLGLWVAHGVQADVAGQGSTIQDALEELQYVIAAAMVRISKSGTPLLPSPPEYEAQFKDGVPVKVTYPSVPDIEPPVNVRVPQIREARVG